MAWQQFDVYPLGARPEIAGIDAHLVWADVSDWRDFGVSAGERRIPVLAEVAQGGLAFLKSLGGVAVPDIYPSDARFVTAVLDADACRALVLEIVGERRITRFEIASPYVPRRPLFGFGSQRQGVQSPLPVSESEVLLGIVDHGCPFAHSALRGPNGPRVLGYWLQDEALSEETRAQGGAPQGFGYGCQLSRSQLDGLIRANTFAGIVDETACYEAAGLRDMRHGYSHGAAVLSILAGARPPQQRPASTRQGNERSGAANDRAARSDIAFVQPPAAALQDSSSGSMGRYLIDALNYIVACAGPKTKHVVINLSDGSSRGTHDGEWLLTQAVDDLANSGRSGKRISIVVGAGNSKNEARHARFDGLTAGEWQGVTMRLMPDSESATQVIVRIPASADLELRVVPPGVDPGSCPSVPRGTAFGWPRNRQAECAVIYPEKGQNDALVALVTWAPTRRLSPDQPCAMPGDWRIEARSKAGCTLPIHLYIVRTQRNPPAPQRAIQSRFVGVGDPSTATGPETQPRAPVCDDGTLNALATGAPGRGIEAVGAVYARDGKPTTYSSVGPNVAVSTSRLGPSRVSIDYGSPVDVSRESPGMTAGGTRSGQTFQVTGTSFAAPQRGREIANS